MNKEKKEYLKVFLEEMGEDKEFVEEAEELYEEIVRQFEDEYCLFVNVKKYFGRQASGVLLLCNVSFNILSSASDIGEVVYMFRYAFGKKHDLVEDEILRILNANKIIKQELLFLLKVFVNYQNFFEDSSGDNKIFVGELEDLAYMYGRKTEVFEFINKRVNELTKFNGVNYSNKKIVETGKKKLKL